MNEMMNAMKVGACMAVGVFLKHLFEHKVIVNSLEIIIEDKSPDFGLVTFKVAKMNIEQQSKVFKFLHDTIRDDIKNVGVEKHLEPFVYVDETTIKMKNKSKKGI